MINRNVSSIAIEFGNLLFELDFFDRVVKNI